ncbi:hypothetical protein EQH57_0207 [Dictyocoela roeselum]|nr:hypothetical protein EQH57_0207 [Dictyocoela roeselum]
MLCLNTKNQHDTYEFIKKLHSELLHPGIHVFEQTIKPYFKIRHCRSIIRKICKECLECQREKDHKVNKRVPHYEFLSKNKNNTVGLDIKGPIKLSNCKTSKKQTEFYILVIMDLFSRYTEVYFIYDICSETICDAFEKTWLEKV